MPQSPSVGRVVHYRLSADQAEAMNDRRMDAFRNRDKMREERPGFQAHIGNTCHEGDIVPLLVVRVWPNEFPNAPEGVTKDGVNGQVFLDGNDALWVTSVGEGDQPGQWFWPPRI